MLGALLVDVLLAAICGVGAGALLTAGNRALESGVAYLVLAAIPGNLVAALVIYLAVRASAKMGHAGVVGCVLLALVHLIVTLGVAAWSSGFLASGVEVVGTHMFTWGMGFAYLEAIQDVHRGTWFGEPMD